MHHPAHFAAPDYPIFLGSEIEQPAPETARFHILPVPYEASVSYGQGTAKGPKHILEASWELETWEGKSYPCEHGIYTHAPVQVNGGPIAVFKNIAKEVEGILKNNALPIILGGEHSLTQGIIDGFLNAGISDFGLVQIDAHADLRDAYQNNPYSHASVMKRILEKGIPIYQLGIRALCTEELEVRKTYNIPFIDAEELVTKNIKRIQLPADFPKKIFLTLDVDGLDPSIFPSTGTPVPGGLGWYQTLSIIESIAQQRQIIGFDVVEFAPIPSFPVYEFSAAQLIYKIMGIVERIN